MKKTILMISVMMAIAVSAMAQNMINEILSKRIGMSENNMVSS